MKKRIIFWVVVLVLLVGLGLWLKYTSTILVGLGGIVLGWIARMLYCKYIKE